MAEKREDLYLDLKNSYIKSIRQRKDSRLYHTFYQKEQTLVYMCREPQNSHVKASKSKQQLIFFTKCLELAAMVSSPSYRKSKINNERCMAFRDLFIDHITSEIYTQFLGSSV